MELFYTTSDESLRLFSVTVSDICVTMEKSLEKTPLYFQIVNNLKSLDCNRVLKGTNELLFLLNVASAFPYFMEELIQNQDVNWGYCALHPTLHNQYPLVLVHSEVGELQGGTEYVVSLITKQFSRYLEESQCHQKRVPAGYIIVTATSIKDLKYVCSVCKDENIDAMLYHVGQCYKLVLNFEAEYVNELTLFRIGETEGAELASDLSICHLNEQYADKIVIKRNAISVINEYY